MNKIVPEATEPLHDAGNAFKRAFLAGNQDYDEVAKLIIGAFLENPLVEGIIEPDIYKQLLGYLE